MKLKLPRKPSIKALDDLNLELIKLRDKSCRMFLNSNTDQRCESECILQNHHLIAKKNHSNTRYNPLNCVCLCKSHHFTFHKVWNDRERYEFIIRLIGIEKYQELEILSKLSYKIDRWTVKLVLDNELKKYQN